MVTLSGAFYYYNAFLTIFEFIPLANYYLLHKSPSQVATWLSTDNDEVRSLHIAFLWFLIVARAGVFFTKGKNSAIAWNCFAVHVSEIFLLGQSFRSSRSGISLEMKLVFAVVLVNPVMYWYLATRGSGNKKK